MSGARGAVIVREPAVTAAADGPVEPGLDRFDEALRPRLMGPRLAAATERGPATCHVLDAKYEPGVRAIVLYAHGGRLLRGDLLPTGDGSAGTTAGARAVVSPGVRICVFPDDPELPALPEVTDPARLGPVLADAMAHHPGVDARRARRCRVRLLRYRPGKRATVLVPTTPGPPTLVVKAYHDHDKAAAVAAEAAALAATTTPAGVLRFAPTLAHVPGLALVVQQAVSGSPLDVLLAGRGGGDGTASAARLAARALAELHELPALSGRQRPVERELQRFAARAERIDSVDARVGTALAQLAQRLTELHAQLPADRPGLVHGDCKPSQFLLGHRHVHLLDLDHCGVSDQAADVGTFLASLRQLAVRHTLARRSPAAGTAQADALNTFASLFLEAYLDRRGADDATRTRIGWQEGVALERKALRAFARAPRSPLPLALVDEAQRCLERSMEAA